MKYVPPRLLLRLADNTAAAAARSPPPRPTSATPFPMITRKQRESFRLRDCIAIPENA